VDFFALLLGVVVLSLFGSLVAADRALDSADRNAAELDARDLALVVEREVRSGGDATLSQPAAFRILESVRDTSSRRVWLALKRADLVLASIGARAATVATAPVANTREPLTVEVAHAQRGRTLRTFLWMLGVIAVVALLVVVARERRQTHHLAARTEELERLYEEVARSNRMKSEFLANVSHELRTPLNAVVGFVEMLRDGVYGTLTPRQALPVDRIAGSATHLRQLVDRLLDIAKIAAGRLEVNAEPIVLRPFVLDVASEMESLASERGLTLTIGIGAGLPRIQSDRTHLRQILINLIGNAVKYTSTGGIEVRGRIVAGEATNDAADGLPPSADRTWIALQVADTGVGIATADRERIFDEFEQVNAGARTDSARRGTGLGLAISRRLARVLGGDLTVASEPGRGSTFTVWLPLDPADEKPG
jgi:signal transduction histidine kinase